MIDKKLDDYLAKALEYYDLPGLAVGIGMLENSPGKQPGFQCTKAVGYKDFPAKEKLLPDHIFHMASVSKLFVSTAVLQLQERGMLDIEMPLVHYLPWFAIADERYKDITIRQMLSQTSGMPDVGSYCWDKPEFDEGALERFARSPEVREAHLLWGTEEGKFSYSNIAYELLGVVIATVSGLSFEDYVRQNIFMPLQMDDTTMLTFERGIYEEKAPWEKVCTPHSKNAENEIIREEHFPYNRAHGPSSTLTSNMADMKKWALAHLEKNILKESTYDLAWAPQAVVPNNGEDICLGWFGRKQEGYTLYGHEGNDDGFRASFWICPELKAYVVVCANITQAPVKRINREIFQMLL